MNEQDKIWLEKCKNNPDKYKVSVDNDCISVDELNPFAEDTKEWEDFDGEHYSFSTYGQEFIIELLKEIGVNADWC